MSRTTDFCFNASGSQKREVAAIKVILSQGTECVIIKSNLLNFSSFLYDDPYHGRFIDS